MEAPAQENTPETITSLQKSVEKLEKKLAKAKSRAHATLQEIWKLDIKLKEEENRASVAEARTADLQRQLNTMQAQLEEANSKEPDAGELEVLQRKLAELEDAKDSAQIEAQVRIASLENELAEIANFSGRPEATLLKEAYSHIANLESELARFRQEASVHSNN